MRRENLSVMRDKVKYIEQNQYALYKSLSVVLENIPIIERIRNILLEQNEIQYNKNYIILNNYFDKLSFIKSKDDDNNYALYIIYALIENDYKDARNIKIYRDYMKLLDNTKLNSITDSNNEKIKICKTI